MDSNLKCKAFKGNSISYRYKMSNYQQGEKNSRLCGVHAVFLQDN